MIDYKSLYELELNKNFVLTNCMRETANRLHKLASSLPFGSDEMIEICNLRNDLKDKRRASYFESIIKVSDARSRPELIADDWVADVKDFMDKFGQFIYVNDPVPEQTAALRNKLLMEEVAELQTAMMSRDKVDIADAIADIIYVALGTALTYGIDLRPVWEEVHRSNMAKEGGHKRPDGKILKPKAWIGPDIAGALKKGSL